MTNSQQTYALPIGLSKPAQRALDNAGIEHLEQLAQHTEAEIMKLHGMGPKAMDLLRREMGKRGLSFAYRSAEAVR